MIGKKLIFGFMILEEILEEKNNNILYIKYYRLYLMRFFTSSVMPALAFSVFMMTTMKALIAF